MNEIDVFSLDVHPDADVFPMLGKEDLEELAADIKKNGLLQPIAVGLVDNEWKIVDGRNWREACRMADVAPHCTYLNGVDLKEYIVSSNIRRRHMTKGQQAMVLAVMFPEGRQGKRGTSIVSMEVSSQRIGHARTIQEYAAELVQSVIAGTELFDAAYKIALERRKALKWKEDGFNLLHKLAPDIAAKVRDGLMDVEQGKKDYEERCRMEKSIRDSVFMGLASFYRDTVGFSRSDYIVKIPSWLKDEEIMKEFKSYFKGGVKELVSELETMKSGVVAIEHVIEELKNGR